MRGETGFSRKEDKNVGYITLFMGCFLVAFICCTLFSSYHLGPMPLMNLEQSVGISLKVVMEKRSQTQQQSYTNGKPVFTNLSNSRSQAYELNGDIRIHGKSSTIFLIASTTNITSNWTVTPYARLGDRTAMARAKKFRIKSDQQACPRQCTRNFGHPAVIFSTGAYAGNQFHDFTDLLIPLYLTSRQFNKSVLFLVSDRRSWWTSKYKHFLENLSRHDVIDIDNENGYLCFSRVLVGLRAHKELGIDSSRSPHYSMGNFRKFLRETYSLDREFISLGHHHHRRLRLLLISRRRTRHLRNEGEVANMARSLGFDVVEREMWWHVPSMAKFVNCFDVMVGVHGAGLTNMVFLPQNGVMIQIVPVGLGSLAKHYFQIPAQDMNLRYLEYVVRPNESSLIGNYSLEHEVFRNPSAISRSGWHDFRSVYLDNQDVNVDLSRFRDTLLKALELVCVLS